MGRVNIYIPVENELAWKGILEAHPDWEHVVFMRRHMLMQLVEVKPVMLEVDEPEGDES